MRGVVVAPQPLAAEAARAPRGEETPSTPPSATAFAQMVTDPQMCGLGGFGCATYAWPGGDAACRLSRPRRLARNARHVGADFRGRTELGNYTLFDDHRANLGAYVGRHARCRRRP